ncbi:MAG: hypothetical protein RQ859_00995 [Pyrobaculum sp.]|jgi:hypothetical protein|nr:hypothetical protein [Pyrobaculum sp.]
MKECGEGKQETEIEIKNLERKIVKKISTILHFTASSSLKPAFDLLITSKCEDLKCLIEFAEKKFRSDIAMWITARITVLKDYFIRNGKLVIYLCLEEFDELIKRMLIGLIYALRSEIPYFVIIDDALAIILNNMYGEVWPAITRPYLASFNYYPEASDMLKFDPVIIAPGGRQFYRVAKPDKYIVMYRGREWEIDASEVYAMAKRLVH